MTVDLAYRTLQFCVNKAQGGYLKPSDANLVLNQGSNSFLDFLLGEIKERKSIVELWMNRKMRNSLSVLIDPPTTLTISGLGNSPFPADYVLIDAMYTTSMNRVRFAQQNALYSYINSVIDPVATNPIYLIESDGFKFYPITLGSAKLSYVKKPPVIVWGYNPDGNGRPIYDSGTSTDPIWSDTDMYSVISRALGMVGINLQAGMVEQYANDIKNNGQ